LQIFLYPETSLEGQLVQDKCRSQLALMRVYQYLTA
jgi:hypothetical protein